MTRAIPKPDEVWKHFKGKTVKIICLATHSDGDQSLVVYRCSSDHSIWARPIEEFMGIVKQTDYPNIPFESSEIYRFTKQPEEHCYADY